MLSSAINFSLDVQECVQRNEEFDIFKLIENYGGNVTISGSIEFPDGSEAIWSESDSSWIIR